jgi:hypothetical protein
MKPVQFPFAVKRGSVTVKIYLTTTHGSESFQAADYSAGTRRLRAFADFARAKTEAEDIARRMSGGGDLDALTLRSADRAAYLRAVANLKPTGAAIESATAAFAEAVKILGGDMVVEAARFYAKRHPTKMATRTVKEFAAEMIEAKGQGGLRQALPGRLGVPPGPILRGVRVEHHGRDWRPDPGVARQPGCLSAEPKELHHRRQDTDRVRNPARLPAEGLV